MGLAMTSRAGRHLRDTLAPLAAVLAFGLLAAACGTSTEQGSSTVPLERSNEGVQESDETPVAGGKIAYGLAAETNGWNPSASQWASSGQEVARTIFDTLSAYDDES